MTFGCGVTRSKIRAWILRWNSRSRRISPRLLRCRGGPVSPICGPSWQRRSWLGADHRPVFKPGAEGAIIATSDEGVVMVPTVGVDVADETGAGDVFLAALAVQRSEGVDWIDATEFANAASAISVAHARQTLPERATVEAARRDWSGSQVETLIPPPRRRRTPSIRFRNPRIRAE